ncbi:energy-coupled thiamine transporter ThiT [Viridibacillus sp. YIM B01967]|uniref:Energy-coupled thiamine transporter ThiT n=1 Tax=Viridibacillus soli TaxID=2798301 RepID=A0ABS1H8N6_9BACL|nr:energy-coupled thiamine transporter ThiT [Viridibacillus soli]MBK3495776.1 energy-coupled thiamine transporter ThiT [Viridibacillus soli]
MNKKRLLFLIEIAIFAAIGLILDQLSFKLWAQGGSISLVMVPIVLMAFRWGVSGGLITGFLIGLLQALIVPTIYTPVQGFIDYFLAFTVVGLAGVVRHKVFAASKQLNKKMMTLYIVLGTVLGGLLRYIAHTAAGIAFFGEYAGGENVYWYAIVYNGTYMLPATILTAIVAVFLFTSAPRLLQQKN